MKKDISNQQFGRLTAKEIVGKDKRGYLWRCECECGGEKIVPAAYLLNQHTRSCGCIVKEKKENSIKKGDRWGFLEAVEFVEYEMLSSGKRRAVWKFKCDCGTEKIMPVANVKFGGTRSCGCKAMAHITNLNKEDITGERYDRLKAIRPTDKRDVTGSIVWEFECECGNTVELSVGTFRSGRVHSCGCKYRETRKDSVKHRHDIVEGTSISNIVVSKRVRANNTSGCTGVSLNSRTGKWDAYINFQKKHYRLGSFKDFRSAVKARKGMEILLHDPIIIRRWNNLTDARKKEFLEYLHENIENVKVGSQI